MKIKSEIVFAVPAWPLHSATVAGGKNAVVAYSKLFLIGQAMQLLRTVLLNDRLTELVLLGGEDSSGEGGVWGGFVWVAAVVSFDEITEDPGEPRLRYTAAAQQ